MPHPLESRFSMARRLRVLNVEPRFAVDANRGHEWGNRLLVM